ncbi:MAG: hypothetical protein M5U09_24085 [Gammaproteobacteria bacterium]|nr:hypothetical protein [Gammaproteobacteria bacterium]
MAAAGAGNQAAQAGGALRRYADRLFARPAFLESLTETESALRQNA